MKRSEFLPLLKALDEYLTERHGDHEGGYAGNCVFCRILSLVEIIGGVATDAVWDEEEAAQ